MVVSYNTRKLVEDCILSIEAQLEGKTEYEIIVVDNASEDGTRPWLESFALDRKRLRIHLSPRNLGFSGGNNAAIPLITGRNVLLFNSDAYLLDDSPLKAMEYLDSHPGVGSLACMLLTGEGKPGPSYGHFPGPQTLGKEFFRFGYGRLRAVCPAPDAPTREIDFPCGAFFMMRSALFRELRGMDESFFLYFEETDLAKRIKDMGYKNVYFGKARAVHLGGQSTTKTPSIRSLRMYYGNWKRYLLKHHSAPSATAVGCALGLYFAVAGLIHSLLGNRDSAATCELHGRAMRDGWSGRKD